MNSSWLESSVKSYGQIEQIMTCLCMNCSFPLYVSKTSSLVWTWQWIHSASWSQVNWSWHWWTSYSLWVGRKDFTFVTSYGFLHSLIICCIQSSLTCRSVHKGIFFPLSAHRLNIWCVKKRIYKYQWSFGHSNSQSSKTP